MDIYFYLPTLLLRLDICQAHRLIVILLFLHAGFRCVGGAASLTCDILGGKLMLLTWLRLYVLSMTLYFGFLVLFQPG